MIQQQPHFWVYSQKNRKHISAKYVRTHVHCSITDSSQEVKPSQMPTDGWTGKTKCGIYIHWNIIQF